MSAIDLYPASRVLGLLDLTSLGEDDTPARIRTLCAAARSARGLPAADRPREEEGGLDEAAEGGEVATPAAADAACPAVGGAG